MRRLAAALGGVAAASAAITATCAVITTWRNRPRRFPIEDEVVEPEAREPRRGDRRPGFRASTALDHGMCTGFMPAGATLSN